MRLYIAASSLDIERAERWTNVARDAGFIIESTWIEVIRGVGVANPRRAHLDERRAWSRDDLRQVRRSALFWLLVPPLDLPTRGAWIELGWALHGTQHIVCSGDTKQSIFCALAEEHDTDEEGFAALCRVRNQVEGTP